MGFMNEEGRTLFLDVPIPELVRRLKAGDLRDRPLLKDKSHEELEDFLSSQFENRIHFYKNAMLKVSGSDITAELLSSEIKKMGWK